MNGILIVNKPKDYTSHDIVRKAKKILNEKVGHTGTLDPNATGVLPLLIGKGTELSKYLINHNKTYEAILKLGEKKDTADSEGKTIEKADIQAEVLEKSSVEKVFKELTGIQEQVPPIYSAIKVKGKKLYEYARKGEEVEIEPRKIEIYKLELINIEPKNQTIEFRVECSKGTYIRTLCEDIAKKLGTIGYMEELKRTKVGDFNIEDSIKIEELEKTILEKQIELDKNEKNLLSESRSFITLEKYFNNKKSIELDDKKLKLFLNGVQLTYFLEDEIYKIYNNNKFIGTGIIKNKFLKREIVI